METTGNLQASRARLAALRAAPQPAATYPGSGAKDALRIIGLLYLVCGMALGVILAMSGQAGVILGGAAILGGILGSSLLFALAAIVENLIAIRRNTEH